MKANYSTRIGLLLGVLSARACQPNVESKKAVLVDSRSTDDGTVTAAVSDEDFISLKEAVAKLEEQVLLLADSQGGTKTDIATVSNTLVAYQLGVEERFATLEATTSSLQAAIATFSNDVTIPGQLWLYDGNRQKRAPVLGFVPHTSDYTSPFQNITLQAWVLLDGKFVTLYAIDPARTDASLASNPTRYPLHSDNVYFPGSTGCNWSGNVALMHPGRVATHTLSGGEKKIVRSSNKRIITSNYGMMINNNISCAAGSTEVALYESEVITDDRYLFPAPITVGK